MFLLEQFCFKYFKRILWILKFARLVLDLEYVRVQDDLGCRVLVELAQPYNLDIPSKCSQILFSKAFV